MSIRFDVVDPADTRELRRSVLRPDRAPGERLPGDDRPDAIHVGALDGPTVLCTCYVYRDPCPWQPARTNAWHLRQMATAPDHRGQGLGGGVLARAAELVLEHGAELLWCNAREPAVTFYARHGFVPHGPIFTDAEHLIAHQRMARELSAPATSSRR